MKKLFLAAPVFFFCVALVTPSYALDAYTPAQEQQFLDWCTGDKTYQESVCSCSLKQLAVTAPPAALATFLSSQGSFSMSTAAINTAATVTSTLVACSK